MRSRSSVVAPPSTPVVCMQNGVENERRVLRHFPHTYGMCVMCPATQLRPGVVQVHSAPVSGMLDLGRFPSGLDERGQAIADAIATTTFQSVARPDIMRWKYRKLLMNLANAVEALGGPEGRFSAAGPGGAARGQGGAGRRGDRRGELRGGPRAAGRLPADARRRRQGSGRGDRAGRAWPGERAPSRRSTSTARSCCMGALHGVPTPVNALLQRLAIRAAAEGAAPGAWRIEELSELAGVPHGE